AGVHKSTVKDYVAGAAVAVVATLFSPRQVELIAQHVQEALPRFAQKLHGFAVDRCADLKFLAHENVLYCCRMTVIRSGLSRYCLPVLSVICTKRRPSTSTMSVSVPETGWGFWSKNTVTWLAPKTFLRVSTSFCVVTLPAPEGTCAELGGRSVNI